MRAALVTAFDAAWERPGPRGRPVDLGLPDGPVAIDAARSASGSGSCAGARHLGKAQLEVDPLAQVNRVRERLAAGAALQPAG